MKKITALTLSILSVFSLAACQPTPEVNIVEKKDTDRMIEQAVSEEDVPSLKEQLNVPDVFNVELTAYNGKLKVSANSEIILPESDGISVARVSPNPFSQDKADKILDYFLQGNTLYEVSILPSRQEVEDRLIKFYGMRDGSIPLDLDGGKGAEYLPELIEEYEQLLKTLPEDDTPTAAVTSFHTPEQALYADAQEITGQAVVNGKDIYLSINNSYYHKNDHRLIFLKADDIDYRTPYSTYSSVNAYVSENELENLRLEMELSEEEAKNIVDDALNQMGITDMVCVDSKLAFDTGSPSNNTGTAGATATAGSEVDMFVAPEEFNDADLAYELEYQHEIDGIPVSLIIDYAQNDVSADGTPWAYEKLRVIVDSTGIVELEYISPYEIEEIITEEAVLLPFSEIVSIFEKMISVYYAYVDESNAEDETTQMTVTEVRLGLARVHEQDNSGKGILIPVWDFIGYNSQMENNNEQSLLTINAIDGSIVDRGRGY